MCTYFWVHRNDMRWLVSFVDVLDDGNEWTRCLVNKKTLFLIFSCSRGRRAL